jgi:hypothetical protein
MRPERSDRKSVCGVLCCIVEAVAIESVQTLSYLSCAESLSCASFRGSYETCLKSKAHSGLDSQVRTLSSCGDNNGKEETSRKSFTLCFNVTKGRLQESLVPFRLPASRAGPVRVLTRRFTSFRVGFLSSCGDENLSRLVFAGRDSISPTKWRPTWFFKCSYP